MTHLICNKGRHAHAACSPHVKTSLVETVGATTCRRCLAVVRTLYKNTDRRVSHRTDLP